jgi:hypothetical protein
MTTITCSLTRSELEPVISCNPFPPFRATAHGVSDRLAIMVPVYTEFSRTMPDKLQYLIRLVVIDLALGGDSFTPWDVIDVLYERYGEEVEDLIGLSRRNDTIARRYMCHCFGLQLSQAWRTIAETTGVRWA